MAWVLLDRGNRREPTQFLKNATKVIKNDIVVPVTGACKPRVELPHTAHLYFGSCMF